MKGPYRIILAVFGSLTLDLLVDRGYPLPPKASLKKRVPSLFEFPFRERRIGIGEIKGKTAHPAVEGVGTNLKPQGRILLAAFFASKIALDALVAGWILERNQGELAFVKRVDPPEVCLIL